MQIFSRAGVKIAICALAQIDAGAVGQMGQTIRMVVMSMAEHGQIQMRKVHAKRVGIVHQHLSRPGVHQNPAAVGFNVKAEPVRRRAAYGAFRIFHKVDNAHHQDPFNVAVMFVKHCNQCCNAASIANLFTEKTLFGTMFQV